MKILGQGDLGKKLTVRVHFASKSAREKIEGAGGTIELLVEPKKPKPREAEARAAGRARRRSRRRAEPEAPSRSERRARAGGR